ncbi:MAG: ABC transporter ATP-binding protein [Pseudomonadota bacterium]
MTTAAFVEVIGASKEFSRRGQPSVNAFQGVDLAVPEKALVGLMGPSGSGKTTLLHAIGGLERLTTGTVRVGERQIEKAGEAQLSKWRAQTVGFVFQFYNLMPMLNVMDNVALPLMLTRLSRKERRRRVTDVVDLVGLTDRARHRPRHLSGGEQQRVAIARAIVTDPPLLLCDEPTGDLDRKTSTEVMTTLRTLASELGKTILMVTHDPEAAKYADHVVHLNKGRIERSEARGDA